MILRPHDRASPILRPHTRLAKIELLGHRVEVPNNNTLLRCLQYLSPEGVSYGRFCWNNDCDYCRITWDRGPGTPAHQGLSCRMEVQEGMRIVAVSTEIRFWLRDLDLGEAKADATGSGG